MERQQAIREFVTSLAKVTKGRAFTNREDFRATLKDAAKPWNLGLDASELKAVMNALSERDESAEPCRDSHGEIESDPELRDTENVPLNQSITDYFNREVRPYIPDAWINESVRDHKDGEIGKIATRSISIVTSTSISRRVSSRR